jgi:hypothetical protein
LTAFISGLGPGFLGAPAPDPNGNMTLTDNDIWGYYMSVGFMKTTVTMASTTDATKKPKVTTITGVSMVCKLFGTSGDLTFSTANNEDQFNNDSNPDQNYKAVGAVIHNTDVAIPNTGVVVCGLDKTATLTGVTFKSLMATFQFGTENDNNTLWKMISFLESKSGSTLNLALLATDPETDPKKKEVYRNAIWCFADVRICVQLLN